MRALNEPDGQHDRPFTSWPRGQTSEPAPSVGSDPGVTVGLHHLGDDRRLLDHGLFRLAMGFRLIEDAGDGRQRMIGRVTLTRGFGLSEMTPSAANPPPAPVSPSSRANAAEFCRPMR
jgi:hypothetical protein